MNDFPNNGVYGSSEFYWISIYVATENFVVFNIIRRAFFTVGIFICCLNVYAADTVDSLVERAREKKLDESRYWHVIMHYNKKVFRTVSEVDDKRFFLSADGKTNPRSELEATIRAFFSESGNADILRFTARYEWLVRELKPEGLKNEKLEEQVKSVLKKFDPDKMSILFSDEYPGAIESAFGHAFLAVYKKNPAPGEEKAIVLNYAGRMNRDPYYVVPFKGLFGGYQGFFSIQDYSSKVNGYGKNEKRAVWEYDLDIQPSDIDKIVLHLNELDSIYCDFFFLDENCSQKLLTLIQPALPDRKLYSHWVYLSPIETIFNLRDSGLIKNETQANNLYDPGITDKVQPHLRHGYTKLSALVGKDNYGLFEELSFLPLYNSMYDENPGMKPGFQLTAFSSSVRYYNDEKKVELEKLSLCDLLIINISKPSGNCAKVKIEGNRFIGEESRPFAFNTRGGYGWYDYSSALGMLYSTIGADINVYRKDGKIRGAAGPGVNAGISRSWFCIKTTIEAEGYFYPSKNYNYIAKASCINSVNLSRYITLNLNGSIARAKDYSPWEVLAGVNLFF